MLKYETENYIFNYKQNSLAEKDILLIAFEQEKAYKKISKVLNIEMNSKIKYYFYDNPLDVGKIYGDNEECNGFAQEPNCIYAVYNDKIKCIGPHEDAHLISYLISNPPYTALREGLAMYFDETWWGRSNDEWVKKFIQEGIDISITKLFDENEFNQLPCEISYPIVGSFTKYLIHTYGIEKYLLLYKNISKDFIENIVLIYQKKFDNIIKEYIDYISKI